MKSTFSAIAAAAVSDLNKYYKKILAIKTNYHV